MHIYIYTHMYLTGIIGGLNYRFRFERDDEEKLPSLLRVVY